MKQGKKHWKKKFEELEDQYKELVLDYNYLDMAVDRLREQCRQWRSKYEEAVSSPEIKADTESAFQRGAAHARQQVVSYLFEAVEALQKSPVMREDKQ